MILFDSALIFRGWDSELFGGLNSLTTLVYYLHISRLENVTKIQGKNQGRVVLILPLASFWRLDMDFSSWVALIVFITFNTTLVQCSTSFSLPSLSLLSVQILGERVGLFFLRT